MVLIQCHEILFLRFHHWKSSVSLNENCSQGITHVTSLLLVLHLSNLLKLRKTPNDSVNKCDFGLNPAHPIYLQFWGQNCSATGRAFRDCFIFCFVLLFYLYRLNKNKPFFIYLFFLSEILTKTMLNNKRFHLFLKMKKILSVNMICRLSMTNFVYRSCTNNS